jgi:transcriptional regulator with XRE-family HTH domain
VGETTSAGTAGDAIRVLRTSQGLTLRQLADLAGISWTYLSQVERGDRVPTKRWLSVVTDALSRNLRGAA